MKKIEYDGEIYYYINNNFVDKYFAIIPDVIKCKIAEQYFSNIDYKNMSNIDLLNLIKEIKNVDVIYKLEEMCDYALSAFSNEPQLIKSLLPIYLSVLRSKNQPEKAIALANNYLHSNFTSSAFYTSLAACYCDIKNYEVARRYADTAYAIQRGSQGYTNELSLVYKRIEKATKIK